VNEGYKHLKGQRVGYVNINQDKLNTDNFVEAYQVLLSHINVLHEEVDGRFIQYVASSIHFEVWNAERDPDLPFNDRYDLPTYDVHFILEPQIEVVFELRDFYTSLLGGTKPITSKTIATELVSVQPLASPTGTKFYLDYAISNSTPTQSFSSETNRSRRKNVW
jgi:hypothetical protein